MELMPDHADSHRLLSGLRVDEMRWQEAAVLARRAVALKPADIDAHNALATALAGPDAGNDWRGRGAGEHAEEAMHHFRRGLQLEAGEESEPASLVLQALHNESALESDGTFVQFFGELGGPKGSLPELDQALSSRERWDPPPPQPPPPPQQQQPPPRTAAPGLAGMQVAALAGLFGAFLLVCWIVRRCALADDRRQRARLPPEAER